VRPKVYQKSEHTISKDHMDPHALSAIETLQSAGYTAYLVGGGVRDLLLGVRPKDFDISTSAKPDEIKKLFQRQCLLIGRRFRLAHLRYGNKILEVSTFRSGDTSSSSLIIRDNHWGTEEEDVMRRDFTMNALFYDPNKEIVLDYVNGVEDISEKTLKTIGDPHLRFKQDPVRMIRLLKFQARFGFHCEEKTLSAMCACKEEIMKSAPARLLEEMFKMLESGKSEPFFKLLLKHEFLELLLPCFYPFFSGPTQKRAFHYLHTVDRAMKLGFHVRREVLIASLIFPIFEQEIMTLMADRHAPLPMREISHLAKTLLHGIAASSFVHFPKKLMSYVYFIVINQFRLTPLKKPPKLHSRFQSKEDFLLALDMLKIRAEVAPKLKSQLTEWEKVKKTRHKKT